jgi:predicted nucleic acid-binding protein
VYTLDTNAIIYYLRDDSAAAPFLQSLLDDPHILVYVSTITEVELFGYPDLSEAEATTINSLLQTVSLIPLESQIARAAGYIRRAYRLKTPDSVIAASALFTGSTLLTRNVRDFKKVPSLKLQTV